MHLADAFIQNDLKCIQAIHFLSVCVLSGNRTHNFCAANAMLYPWATGTLCFIQNFTAFFHHRNKTQRIQFTHLTHHTQTVVVVYQFKGGSCIFMNLVEGNFVYIDFYHGQTEFYSFSSLFQFYCGWIVNVEKCYIFKLVVKCKLLLCCNETTPLAVVIWFRPIHISDSLISQSVSERWARACIYTSSATTASNRKTNVHSGFSFSGKCIFHLLRAFIYIWKS